MVEITSIKHAMCVIDQLREQYGVTIDELVTDEYINRSQLLKQVMLYLSEHIDEGPGPAVRWVDEWRAGGVFTRDQQTREENP